VSKLVNSDMCPRPTAQAFAVANVVTFGMLGMSGDVGTSTNSDTWHSKLVRDIGHLLQVATSGDDVSAQAAPLYTTTSISIWIHTEMPIFIFMEPYRDAGCRRACKSLCTMRQHPECKKAARGRVTPARLITRRAHKYFPMRRAGVNTMRATRDADVPVPRPRHVRVRCGAHWSTVTRAHVPRHRIGLAPTLWGWPVSV
jgi:hypothetical protein